MLLTTIGYEGLNVQSFFSILNENNVTTLVDVRELPISRKPGFSKSALSQNALSFGMKYIHIPELGSPRNLRREYREDNDWQHFSEQYRIYLKTQKEPLEELSEIVSREICCLMCFEADFHKCHRRYISNAIFARFDGEIQINHLVATKTMVPAGTLPLVDIPIQQ